MSGEYELLASIITGSATLLVGIVVVLISQDRIKKREIEETHRESKIELYNRFNDFLFKLLVGVNDRTSVLKPSEQHMIDFMVVFKRDLIFRASPAVIKTVLEYEIGAKKIKDDQRDGTIFIYMNDILLSMRDDIGLSNKSLKNLELIQLYIKDVITTTK